MRQSDRACFLDPSGNKRVAVDETRLPALGHDFHLVISGNEQVETCQRCGATGVRKPIVQQELVTCTSSKSSKSNDDGPASESEFQLGNIGAGYEITKYLGSRSHVIIPEEIRGRKVVSIGKSAFAGKSHFRKNKSLTYVKIPKTVTIIKANAFAFCSALKCVDMHEGIQEIQAGAFFDSGNIDYFSFGVHKELPKVVFFPKGLRLIGGAAFGNYDALWGSKCYLREATISKKTKMPHIPLTGKTLDCAVFYYEDQ